ncbi:uncharacterized protein L3040_000569 [Drepanopeziza brunnea f. sp. 'multigermtubi']|uniref:Kinetochore protein fta7 n=1 Tax=Marssonina brunnea f. sp. multigermtubi (strain MB_m1) TaxID=1072389 RepID=K1WUN9_MARBU|nr:kinetochore protein fta7 [Drepanopeziza brunnea f. sp. 'multigermtubi' MB_m1]EKD21395.1 kinetochore protein fta7 [Drepanopeziza brunnea f. sp. 'multigermtubi' MB_m1]KAJ5054291.1 hypothetical protein L3040_000569 [Drepanopeziza brunnea f. sp. 'multigermtubi']
MQASPERTTLKRQRSRPSAWWAAPPSNAPPPWVLQAQAQPAEEQIRERERQAQTQKRKDGAAKRKRGISEAPQAGNRGVSKSRAGGDGGKKAENRRSGGSGKTGEEKGKGSEVHGEGNSKVVRRGKSSGGAQDLMGLEIQMGESGKVSGKGQKRKPEKKGVTTQGWNGSAAEENEKALRRGRSSGGEAELRALGESSMGTEAASGDTSAAARLEEDDKIKSTGEVTAKKRGRSAATHVDELDAQEDGEHAVARRRGRSSVVGAQMQVEKKPTEETALRNQGRPVVVHDEDQVDELVDETLEMAAPKKKSHRSPAVPMDKAEGALKKASERRGRLSISGQGPIPKPLQAPVDEAQRATKKRGRPTAPEGSAEAVSDEPATKKKRGRIYDNGLLEPNMAQITKTGAPVRGRARTRPSDVVEPEPSKPRDQDRGRKRTRQSDVHIAEPVAQLESRGRRRTRRSAEIEQDTVPELAHKAVPKAVKAKRRSEVIEVEAASSKLTRSRSDKRAKPATTTTVPKAGKASSSTQPPVKTKKGARSATVVTEIETPNSAPSQTRRKNSKRSSEVEVQSRKHKAVEKPEPLKRRRSSKLSVQDQHEEPEPELAPYQHLRAVTRKVSRQTIEKKWEPLPPLCVDRITQLLQDTQRPVLVHLHDEKKKSQASSAMQSIARRLTTKVSRGLPFPPGSRKHREDDFDFEKIVELNRVLEAQLTPALHSNALLEAELRKELAMLELEKASMVELETNANSEAVARNKAARKLHHALQLDDVLGEEVLRDDIGLDFERRLQPLAFGLQDDPDLQDLVNSLEGHVNTVQGNLKQVEGVSQAMANSRAAVQATLFHRLDSARYDDVVLGFEE